MFDGFQFSAENPYTYREGKRLLKLVMLELRREPTIKALGIDPRAAGRSAITGSGQSGVWDFIPLRDRPRAGLFTAFPHLTLSLDADRVEAAITIPNGVMRAVRRRLAELGVEGLTRLNARIVKRARRIISAGGSLQAYAVQRHYPSQRSAGVVDARVTFRLETSLPRNGPIKQQVGWVQLFADLLQKRRANIQFGYTVQLPLELPVMRTRRSVQWIGQSWHALAPLLDVVRTERPRQGRAMR